MDNKRKVLKNLVLTIRKEGFCFLEEAQAEHGGWQKMSMDSAIGIVRRRMQCLQVNSNLSNKLLGKMDVLPGPFIQMEGVPTGRLLCVGKVTKQRAIILTRRIEKRYPQLLRSC